MFETLVGLPPGRECDAPFPGLDAAAADSSTGEQWSRFSPSGLLLDVLSGFAPEAFDADQALEATAALGHVIALAQATQLRMVARFAELRPATAGRSFSEFAADELGAALHVSRNAAATQLALAVQLTGKLPATLQAMERGEVDMAKARALCDVTASVSAQHAAAVEQRVLPRAPEQTAPQLRASARRAVLAVDPGGAQARHEHARRDRRVQLFPVEDGMAELHALLPAEQAIAIYQRVDSAARSALDAADARTADQRRADAFVDLLLGTGGSSAVTTQVHVTVAATTLAGLDERPGDLAGYGPIPASLARELASGLDGDATWRRLLTDPATGTLLDHGRRTYRPPAALARFVRARDKTCRFPGCRQPARRCDVDHTVAYPAGPTSENNLGTLCRHHHRLKHESRWAVEQGPGGELRWTSPTGRRYRTAPEPLADPDAGAATTSTDPGG